MCCLTYLRVFFNRFYVPYLNSGLCYPIASDNASFGEIRPIDNRMLFLYEEASYIVLSKPLDLSLNFVASVWSGRNRIV